MSISPDERARAEVVVADMFCVHADHIPEAPAHCGDGYDGACDRDNCHIVAAVDKLLAYGVAQRAEVLRALDPTDGDMFSGKSGTPPRSWYEDKIFNEARLYTALGKEDARTVLGIFRRYADVIERARRERSGGRKT